MDFASSCSPPSRWSPARSTPASTRTAACTSPKCATIPFPGSRPSSIRAAGGKKTRVSSGCSKTPTATARSIAALIFADKLTWPTSVCCYRGGCSCSRRPTCWYFKDTDGDGVADVRKIVFTGFRRDNVQAVVNSLKWSLDNRIVFAAGRNGGNLLHDGKKVFCDPWTGHLARSGELRTFRDHRRRAIRPVLRRLGKPLRLQQQQPHRAGRARGAVLRRNPYYAALGRDSHDRQGGAGRSRLSPQSARAVARRPHAAPRLRSRPCCARCPYRAVCHRVFHLGGRGSRFIAATPTRPTFAATPLSATSAATWCIARRSAGTAPLIIAQRAERETEFVDVDRQLVPAR